MRKNELNLTNCFVLLLKKTEASVNWRRERVHLCSSAARNEKMAAATCIDPQFRALHIRVIIEIIALTW